MKKVIVIACLLCCGCSTPKRTLSLDLTERKFDSNTVNTDVEIGSIEYIEEADGSTHLIIKSYKVAEQEAAIERDKALLEAGKIAAGVAAGAVLP